MANDLTSRPWIVDTIANPIKPTIFPNVAGQYAAGGFGTNASANNNTNEPSRVALQGIVFYGVTANDTATFQDYRGRQIIKLTCVTGGQPVSESNFVREGTWVQGLALTQISSGYCEVYVR